MRISEQMVIISHTKGSLQALTQWSWMTVIWQRPQHWMAKKQTWTMKAFVPTWNGIQHTAVQLIRYDCIQVISQILNKCNNCENLVKNHWSNLTLFPVQVCGYRSNNGISRRSPTAPPYNGSVQTQEQNMCLPVHPTNMTEHEMRHEQLLKQGITINVPPIGTINFLDCDFLR